MGKVKDAINTAADMQNLREMQRLKMAALQSGFGAARKQPFNPIPLDQIRAEIEAQWLDQQCSFCGQPVWHHWHRNRANTDIADPGAAARYAECEYPRNAAIEQEFERRVVEQTSRLLSGETATQYQLGYDPAGIGLGGTTPPVDSLNSDRWKR